MTELQRRSQWLQMNDAELVSACTVHTYRARGPGGQKRNKTDSAVRLHHDQSGVIVQAEESRSQAENRRRAMRRLREALALKVRDPVVLDPFEPPGFLTQVVQGVRLRINRRNPDYARVVGCVLDVFFGTKGRLRDTSRLLGLSTGSLIRFLAENPRLWQQANRIREDCDLGSLNHPGG